MRKETVYRIFSHIPTLETPRLTLRGMRVSDAEDVFDYASREEVTRYLLWSPHPDIEYTRRYLTYIGQRYRTGDFFDWAMVSRETGHMIGTCGFTSFNFSADSGEIGYVLNPVLEEKSGEQYGDEGCLSVPGLWYKTRRADYARVRGIDLDGNEVVLEGSGLMGRMLQHETDHLDGHVYLDRLEKTERREALRYMREHAAK